MVTYLTTLSIEMVTQVPKRCHSATSVNISISNIFLQYVGSGATEEENFRNMHAWHTKIGMITYALIVRSTHKLGTISKSSSITSNAENNNRNIALERLVIGQFKMIFYLYLSNFIEYCVPCQLLKILKAKYSFVNLKSLPIFQK